METGTQDLELWKNQGQARVVVKKRGEYGVVTEEQVTGGRALQITPTDRRMNQESAATPALDVFTNGMLTPVRLLESDQDFKEIAENPNLMTEEDLHSLAKAHPKTFAKRLPEITNPVVIRRLVQIARDEDCTVSRVEAIEGRLRELQDVPTISRETVGVTDPEHDPFKEVKA